MPTLSPDLLAYLGNIAAFITTLNVARYLRFSMKLPVESDGLSWGWGGSDYERRPLPSIFCIYYCT